MPLSTKRLTDVPEGEVGKKVQSFITRDGAEKVTAEKNGNKKWTVEAKVPATSRE